MTLTYASGIATSQVDLLDALETFAVTGNSWTKDAGGSETYSYDYESENDSEPNGKELHLHKTDSYGVVQYFHFYACYKSFPFPKNTIGTPDDAITLFGHSHRRGQLSGIAIMGSRGYNGSASQWWDHTIPSSDVEGGSIQYGSTMAFMIGQTLPYWMFCQGDSIHVVVEVFPGEFQHMSFGTLVKSYSYVGGQYFMASNAAWNCMHHRHENGDAASTSFADSCPWGAGKYGSYLTPVGAVYAEIETKYWGTLQGEAPNSEGETVVGIPRYYSADSKRSFFGSLMFCSPSILTSLSPQFPLYVRRYRGDNGEFNYLGYPEGVRVLNMKTLNSKQVNTLGSDDWKIFPAGRTKTDEDYYAIGVPGLSYLGSPDM